MTGEISLVMTGEPGRLLIAQAMSVDEPRWVVRYLRLQPTGVHRGADRQTGKPDPQTRVPGHWPSADGPQHAGVDLATRVLSLAAHPGIGAVTIRRMATQLGGWAGLAAAGDDQVVLLAQAFLGKRALCTPATWTAAVRCADITLATVRGAGAQVLVPGAPAWPTAVERLGADAPLWLFVRGDSTALTLGGVAVIGSRHPTSFGLACARRFGQRVAEAGKVVISGLALGCDGAAHSGCVEGYGRGVAVLPGPIDRVVPSAHRDLAEDLLRRDGCWVGEYPPDPTADVPAHQFIARDRIQAGLAHGVLLVESGADGGSRHAVHAAQRLHIPIACLMRADPGWLAQPVTQLNQALVRDGAATPLHTAAELQAWLGGLPIASS
jgi:DNA processing protein